MKQTLTLPEPGGGPNPIKKGICAFSLLQKAFASAQRCVMLRADQCRFWSRNVDQTDVRLHSRRFGNGKKRRGTDKVGNSGPDFQGYGTHSQAGQRGIRG